MNKLFFNPISVIVFTIVVFTLSLSIKETSHRATATKQELQSLQKEVSALQSEAVETEQLVAERRGEFVREKIARDELLLQKPNELIVQLPPITPKPEPTPIVQQHSPLEEWKRAIFWKD